MTQTVGVDADLVRRLIADQFPRYWKLPVAAVVPGGHDNRTFRVGDSLCARLPSAGRYAPHLLVEHEWLPRLARHLPLPIPQPAGLGAPGAGYPWPWALYRWIPGEPATAANMHDLSDGARRLAGFLTALHGADTAGAPAPGLGTSTAAAHSPSTRPKPIGSWIGAAAWSTTALRWPRGAAHLTRAGRAARCGCTATSPPATCWCWMANSTP